MLERIRASILDGKLPAGAKLIESELAEQFGTSRGPIREALRELAREGLVLELPRRGAVVSTLTARDLSEVYAVREALELGATRAAVARATDSELRRLERNLLTLETSWDSAASYLESAAHDLAFHRALVELSRNGRLIALYEQMLGQTMLLLRTAAEVNPTLRTVMPHETHRDIFDALLAHDLGRVGEALAAHYRYAQERLFAGFDSQSE